MSVKVKLNMRGVNAVLNDPAVVASLEGRAKAIAAEANAKARSVWPQCREDPYVVKVDLHPTKDKLAVIPAAHVYTKTKSKKPGARGCDFLNKKYGILASSINAGK